jgi:KRAB domain-containing zinc finger protein
MATQSLKPGNPAKCEYCEKTFSKHSYIKDHIKVVHLKEKQFLCTICDKFFGIRLTLEKHILSVHNEVKPFKYGICDKPFRRLATLKVHVYEVHKKLKPFKCQERQKYYGCSKDPEKHESLCENN